MYIILPIFSQNFMVLIAFHDDLVNRVFTEDDMN